MLAYIPFKQTNETINKLICEFSQICSEILGSVNALTTSREEIISSLNVDQMLFTSTQISSISTSE